MRVRLLAAVLAVLAAAPAVAAPLLRSVEVRIDLQTPTSCVVELRLRVEGASAIEHRLAHAEGTETRLLDVVGAAADGEPRRIGRTLALIVRPAAPDYTVRYAVDWPERGGARCPLWIPTVATDGQSRAVQVIVSIPAGTVAGETLPALTWNGTEGSAQLGHLPVFVHVPITASGSPAPTSVARLMDSIAVGTLVLTTLAWAARRRRLVR